MNGRFRQTLLLISMLLLSGCSFIRIQNVTNLELRFQIITPDSGQASTRVVRSGSIVDVLSTQGGPYTVTIISDEEYRQLLLSVQEQISKRLFEEGEQLTASEIADLVDRIRALEEQLAEISNLSASCSGVLPEFDTVIVTASQSQEGGNWELYCP